MMGIGKLLDSLPLWGVYLATALLSLVAVEAGFQVGKLWQQRAHTNKEGSIGLMVSATLGLLAFLLAFVIGIAANRFDTRRALVVEEANAIGTTWLRAGFLDTPAAEESRELLREYVNVRVDSLLPGRFETDQVRAEQIHSELWSRAETVAAANKLSPITALYIETLNDLIDVYTKRITAVTSSRIPVGIWGGIYVISTLTMVLVGLQSSFSEQRNWVGIVLLILVFSAVLTLIIDLDRPMEGLFSVSQQAMLNLQAQLGAQTP